MKYRIIAGMVAASFLMLPLAAAGAGNADKGSEIPRIEKFGGGGEKLEKPGKTGDASGEKEPLEKPKLTKPGKETTEPKEKEPLVKPGKEPEQTQEEQTAVTEETQGTDENKLVKPGKDVFKSAEREKLQKPRKGDFQKSDQVEVKEVATTGEGLEISSLEFYDIFPVFYKYYDQHPVAKAVLHNYEKAPITDIRMSLFIHQYMDVPKESKAPSEIEADGEAVVELNALFNNKVLEITEGTKVAAEITYEYTLRGKTYTNEYTETIRIFDRNATTWDDDRKAAAFVTAKDPSVLRFSKNIVGMIKDKGSKSINANLLTAMALYEAISLYGTSYVIDPTTPYAEYSENKQAVDFLQFPRQTLEYRAGDCDDLSILYSALLESIGVETAFITIPGHIFMAFSLDMSPEQARKSFSKSDDLIYREEKTWLPVEVTMLGEGFLKAWQTGAKQWREAVSNKKEGFYPMHGAWKIYEPVGLPGITGPLELPESDKLVSVYLAELIKYIDQEIYPKVASIREQMQKTGETTRLINKLGVIYAQYGLTDKAEKEFSRALAKDDGYVPALMNLGNVYYLNDDMETALKYYDRAAKQQPDNPKVLLCVARANHELENYGSARRSYNKLREINPELANQYAYLDMRGDEATRASDAKRMKKMMVWDEEE